jgi:carnitine O-acetyltransferase
VVEDGYGLSYAIHEDNINWCITTKNNNAEKFGKALCDAAEEMKAMMDRVAKGENKTKAKL